MAERITSNLWRLDIPLEGNPLKNLNSYLLVGQDRSLLIDTGFRQDSCRRALTDQLVETGVDRERLDIFLTHLHSDHTGLAPEFVGRQGNIYISTIDGEGLRMGLSTAIGSGCIVHMWTRAFQRRRSTGFGEPILPRERHPGTGDGTVCCCGMGTGCPTGASHCGAS